MKIINIGILAHVDAGKTTLTESLLYTSGAIAEQGNVDKGTTRTDTMILERQRGITIQTAVTSFCWNDYKINIVDTPGHMDFLTEAYRSLSVLDGAVLVISAKDGVQAQTRILFHALQKMNIPTIIFVNKIDQNGIDLRRVYQSIKDKLTSDMIVMQEVALSPKITITDISDLDKWDINSRRDSIKTGDQVANTLLARDWKGPQCVQVGEVVGEKWDKMHDISRRVYEPDGISPTVHCQQGGNTELKIAENFVLGGLQAHQTPRTDGIIPALTEAMGKGGGQTPVIIDTNQAAAERFFKQAVETVLENDCEVGDTVDAFNKKVNRSGVCPTITTRPEGFKTAILPIVEDRTDDPVIAAMRGRNPDNPSDRTSGAHTEQRLEVNDKGLCNTLTSVQKDNLVLEQKKGSKEYVARRYREFIEKHGYIPKNFVAYNKMEVDDIAPTLTGQCSCPSGSSAVLMMEEPVQVKVATKQGYEEAERGDFVNITYPGSKTKRGRVGKGIAHTLTCGDGNAVITENIRIRKLTPRECLRLMGWLDEQIDKIQAAKISGTQQYRQAGNGIVVQVLEAIFKALFFGER